MSVSERIQLYDISKGRERGLGITASSIMAVACCREPFAGGPGCVCLLSCVGFLLGVMGVCECEMLDATAGGVSTTLDRAL